MRVKHLFPQIGILAAALAIVGFSLRAGYHADESVIRLLSAPTVIEQWEAGTLGYPARQPTAEEPALLKQARLFANLLNPPKPRSMPRPRNNGQQESPVADSPIKASPSRPVTVSPKFVLLATSCYPANPLKSLALIDEPGRGQRWIRPGTRLGHLIVDKIDKGSIGYRDGDMRYTMLRTMVEKGIPDADGKPGRPSVTGQRETYANNVPSAKVTAKSREVSSVQPSIKRPAFQRLGPKR